MLKHPFSDLFQSRINKKGPHCDGQGAKSLINKKGPHSDGQGARDPAVPQPIQDRSGRGSQELGRGGRC